MSQNEIQWRLEDAPSEVGPGVLRLAQVYRRGPAEASYVLTLLDAAVHAAENHRAHTAVLPAAEQEIWESVGAVFGDDGAIARVRMQAAAAFADLVARSIRGDAELAALLKVDRSRISQRVAERSLYCFEIDGGERCFPRWQLLDGRPLRGLRTVLAALDPALHPLTVDHWFRTPSVDLAIDEVNSSPVEWLATGGSPEVLVGLLPGA